MSEPAPNNPLPGRTILLSVSPQEWERIRDGKQTVILRKKWARQHTDYAVLYATAPVSAIVGAVRLGFPHVDTILEFFYLPAEQTGMSEEEIESYFGDDCEWGWRIPIASVEVVTGTRLSVALFGLGRGPRTFVYLEAHAMRVLTDTARVLGTLKADGVARHG